VCIHVADAFCPYGNITVMTTPGVRRLTLLVVSAAAALAGAAMPVAFEATLDRPAMTRAMKLARWPATDADRAAFHARYMFDVRDAADAPIRIDRIEVMTEFRRLELLAEHHARLNDLWGRTGTRDAEEALAPWRGAISITAHGTYRDLAYPSPDPAEITIRLDKPAERARRHKPSTDWFGSCGSELSCTITGATIEADFEAAPLARAVRPVVVEWKGRPLAQMLIDFSKLD
jgi:hypothetical protein